MNVTNGTVTMKHVGTDMEWTAMTTVFDVTAGGVLNLSEVAVTNLGGTAMAFCVHLNNWGEVTLNVTNSTIKSTYCAVRVFNSGPDKNNVTITDSTIHGDNRAIWVHNYTAADFGSSYDADAVNGRLNFNIFNDTNTITAGTDGTKVNPVYYGFTDTIYYDGNGNCVATSANSLASGLASGANVTLTEDITEEATATAPYGNNVGFVHNGGTLDGGGNAITVTGGNDTYAIMTYGGTMKNLTVDSGVRGIVLYAPTKDVIIEDVTINGPGYGINTAEHPTVDGIDLIVTNSTINGWSSFAGIASASFTECTFGANTTKFWEGQGYDSVYDRLVKPYVDTLFKDCVFKQKVYLDLSALGEGCQITLDQCTADGTLITADNYTTLLEAIELPTGKTLADCVIFQ